MSLRARGIPLGARLLTVLSLALLIASLTPAAALARAESPPTGPTAVADAPVTGVRSVSAGNWHSCMVGATGTITCWGYNGFGQANAPSGTFTQVAAGGDSTCALRTDDTIACWGYGETGQTSPPSGTFAQIDGGGSHYCGIRTDGTVACWGNDLFGETAPPSGTFTQVSAGAHRSCGVRTDGTVTCWGFTDPSAPFTPPAGTFTQVAVGDSHACGLRTDGTLACWGSNEHGESTAPPGIFTSVSASGDHTCGLVSDGTVVCWGRNDYGEGTAPSGTFAQAHAGYWHNCGVMTDQSIACWGRNDSGQATPPTPTLSIGDASAAEGDPGTPGTVTFTVTLSQPWDVPVTAEYVTFDWTATAAVDYVAATGNLTFAAGETTKTFDVPIIGDTLNEGDEYFTVNLYNPTHSTISDPVGLGTIVDDDAMPSLSVADISVTEGTAGSSSATFTVSLSGTTTQTVTVDYSTVNDTATAGSDYTATSGTLTFTPGDTSETISVAITGDTADEPDERFFVDLANASNAKVADGQAAGTITDDDGPPALSIADVNVTEANATTNATFTVSLAPASGKTVTVSYATADGTATAGADYTAATGTLSFAPGATTRTFTVAIAGDLRDEWTETFAVGLSNASNATIGDAQATATIADDDPLPAITINDVSIVEGDVTTYANFRVALSQASGKTVYVRCVTADGTAHAGSDYTARTQTLSFTPGVISRTASIAITGENVAELTERFYVDLSAPTNTTITDARGVGTITDDDPDDPFVKLTKTGPETAAPGSLISYSISYKNMGPHASGNASATDTLPAELTFQSASTGGTYDAATRTVTWRLGTVPKGTTGTLTLVARVASTVADGTFVRNRADFHGDATHANPAFAKTRIER